MHARKQVSALSMHRLCGAAIRDAACFAWPQGDAEQGGLDRHSQAEHLRYVRSLHKAICPFEQVSVKKIRAHPPRWKLQVSKLLSFAAIT